MLLVLFYCQAKGVKKTCAAFQCLLYDSLHRSFRASVVKWQFAMGYSSNRNRHQQVLHPWRCTMVMMILLILMCLWLKLFPFQSYNWCRHFLSRGICESGWNCKWNKRWFWSIWLFYPHFRSHILLIIIGQYQYHVCSNLSQFFSMN